MGFSKTLLEALFLFLSDLLGLSWGFSESPKGPKTSPRGGHIILGPPGPQNKDPDLGSVLGPHEMALEWVSGADFVRILHHLRS